MQVGRYQVIDVIGAGANSKVVRAHDPMIGRIVAIKLFSPALAQGAGRDRFLQEARVVGQLSHPTGGRSRSPPEPRGRSPVD